MSTLQLLNHVDHQVANHVEHLEVVVLELHLHIETCEFAEMPVGVGVLSPEDRPDLKDSLQVSA